MLLSIPILLIAIIISTLMEPSLMNAMFATLLAILPYFVHAIYQADSTRAEERLCSLTKIRWDFKLGAIKSTILPDISAIYTQEIARAFVVAILDITALSFISLGAQRPMPEWGQ